MNKNILGVVVVVLLALGAFLFMSPSSPLKSGAMNSGSPVAGSSPFTSIQDALSRSLSLECSFTDDGGRQTKSYVKAGAVRTDFTGKNTEDSGSAIIKGKKMYYWNTTKKEGFMMEVPAVTPGKSESNPAPSAGSMGKGSSASEVYSMLEKFKNSCRASAVADSLFTPPTDVKFQDYSEMMKGFKQMMDTPKTGGYNEESVKQMMQKYGSGQ